MPGLEPEERVLIEAEILTGPLPAPGAPIGEAFS